MKLSILCEDKNKDYTLRIYRNKNTEVNGKFRPSTKKGHNLLVAKDGDGRLVGHITVKGYPRESCTVLKSGRWVHPDYADTDLFVNMLKKAQEIFGKNGVGFSTMSIEIDDGDPHNNIIPNTFEKVRTKENRSGKKINVYRSDLSGRMKLPVSGDSTKGNSPVKKSGSGNMPGEGHYASEGQIKSPTGKHVRDQSMFPSSFGKSKSFGGVKES